jgi:negative regulator of sigma E activity
MNDRTESAEPEEPAEPEVVADSNREPVSALVDGELDARGADFLLRRLGDDEEMHRHWQRCHLVRACLQHEFEGPVSLVGRVQGALAAERAPQRVSRMPSVMRLGLGGAIAASVAIFAVTGLDHRMSQQESNAASAESQPDFVSQPTLLDRQFSAEAVPAGFGAASSDQSGPVMSGQGNRQVNRQRINGYMIRHSQAAGSTGFDALTPVLAAPETVRLAPQRSGAFGKEAEDARR